MSERSSRLAYLALFTSLALVLGYVEAIIPVPASIPGVKLGLANVAVLMALYLLGPRGGLSIMLLKVAVTSLIIGAPSMIIYSLAGSFLAFLGMLLCWKLSSVSVVVTSVVAALLHNVGQLMVALAVLQTPLLLLNAPLMILAACVTGLLTGALAAGVLKALPALPPSAKRKLPQQEHGRGPLA